MDLGGLDDPVVDIEMKARSPRLVPLILKNFYPSPQSLNLTNYLGNRFNYIRLIC